MTLNEKINGLMNPTRVGIFNKVQKLYIYSVDNRVEVEFHVEKYSNNEDWKKIRQMIKTIKGAWSECEGVELGTTAKDPLY